MCVGNAGFAFAEDEPAQVSRAVSLNPIESSAPWLDLRAPDIRQQEPEWLATGRDYALVKDVNGRVILVDSELNEKKVIAVPENVKWM